MSIVEKYFKYFNCGWFILWIKRFYVCGGSFIILNLSYIYLEYDFVWAISLGIGNGWEERIFEISYVG